MDNPWMQLPEKPPYVLPSDVDAVASFNKEMHKRGHEERKLYVNNKLPEPFIGNRDAPIVLLNLNPRFDDGDDRYLADPYARALQLGNLRHAPSAYPFYHLDPGMKAFGGATWWKKHLTEMLRLPGVRAEDVAKSVFCVEFLPYSSRNDPDMRSILDSQLYGFHLVNRAIDRGALIVLMRAQTKWFERVPRLVTYDRRHICSSARAASISPGNLPTGFSAIERILRA